MASGNIIGEVEGGLELPSYSGAYGGTASGGTLGGDFVIGGGTSSVLTTAVIGTTLLVGFGLWLALKK